MKLSDLFEGINDTGLFKAVFFAGLPGAGKTYVATKIASGRISPRIVNTDKMFEFLAKKHTKDISQKDAWDDLGDTAKQLSKQQLSLYLNSMSPLYIDGTSSNVSSVFRRIGILQSIGYDVAMVWINTDIETAMQRAQQRDRYISQEFIKQVNSEIGENKLFYKTKITNFVEVNNNDGELNDVAIRNAFNKISNFYSAQLENPIGTRILNKLSSSNDKYLSPSIMNINEINNLVNSWYIK